ncbi:hypothetical protein D3C71_1407500 [compost metagenome]
MAAKFVAFPVRICPLPVPVNLVGCHHDNRLGGARLAQGLQDVDGAHDVDCIGACRFGIAGAHQRLGCQVQHDIWLNLAHFFGQGGTISHVQVRAFD